MGIFCPAKRWVVWISLCGLLWAAASSAEEAASASAISLDSVRFRTVSISDGLSQSTVRAIAQDDQGFLWLASQDGLSRFDGNAFRIFHKTRFEPDSLPDNHVTALLADGEGLWVGTLAGGLSYFDLRTERFRHWPVGADGLAGVSVLTLAKMQDGRLLVSTTNGPVQVLDPVLQSTTTIPNSPVDINAFLPLPSGWLFGGVSGLYAWDGQDTLVPFAPTLPRQSVAALAAHDNDIFVGLTQGGLLRLTTGGEQLAWYQSKPGDLTTLQSNDVRALLSTRAGELWVAGMAGVSLLLPDGQRFLNWSHDPGDPTSLPANRVVTMLEANNGLLLFGSWTGGLGVHVPSTRALQVVRQRIRDGRSLPANPVRDIWRDSDGSLWLGQLEGGGLVHYDPAVGVIERFVHAAGNPYSLAADNVQAVARTPDGVLWVGSIGGGLQRLEEDGRFMTQRLDRSASGVVKDLMVDRAGTLWIGTDDAGVAALCLGCSELRWYGGNNLDTPAFPAISVNEVFEARNGQIWVALHNGGGLIQLDTATGQFQHYPAQPDKVGGLSHGSITTFYEAESGELWIGTQGGGANRAEFDDDGRIKAFRSLSTLDGLGADAIGAIQGDRSGRIWIATTVGINIYDPVSNSIRALTISDGLDRSGYFIGARALDPDGTVSFGGLAGLVRFNPDRIGTSPRDYSVEFSTLRIFNQEVTPRSQLSLNPLQQSISRLTTLELDERHTLWSVTLTAFNFAAKGAARYQYRLDDFDRDWIDVDSVDPQITYTGVPPGSYQLRVRASAAESWEFGPERVLEIRIAPPVWRTWWALLLYTTTAFAALSLLLWRMRLRNQDRELAAAQVAEANDRLQQTLWASRDELWDADLVGMRVSRDNLLPTISLPNENHHRGLADYIQYVHPDDRDRVSKAFNAHTRGESDAYEVTYRVLNGDGSWVWILSRGRVTERDSAGRAIRMLGTNKDISALKNSEEALRRLNEELEIRVARRTEALVASNHELKAAMQKLSDTQVQLVESEKMASLGNLVAGVAHEINTPIGVCVTAASHLAQASEDVAKAIDSNLLRRSQIESFKAVALESARLLLTNLERASQLVRSFKQVAVDQSSEDARLINLSEYLEEVLFALRPKWKHRPIEVQIVIDPTISLVTYPGAIYQIIANLITNSLTHGFEEGRAGTIRLEGRVEGETIFLNYRDNGRGMTDEVRSRIFEPFFTTRRGSGGSGLGMHIVYNLVAQLLKGKISCSSAPHAGASFSIELPKT